MAKQDPKTDKVDVVVPGTGFSGSIEIPEGVTEEDLANNGMTEVHREPK